MHQDGPGALGGPGMLMHQLHKGEQGARGLWDAVVWPSGELQLLYSPLFVLGTLRQGWAGGVGLCCCAVTS